MYIFIHSEHFYSASSSPLLYSKALPTTAILTLCRSLHAEELQATVSEGLAQGPYVAARAGFEPTTLQSKAMNSTNAAAHLTNYSSILPLKHSIV